MAKILYNYDHPTVLQPPESPQPATVISCDTAAQPLKNAKGEVIGIKAKRNSSFDLYFDISGFIDKTNFATISSQATCSFELFNFRHQSLLSLDNLTITDNQIKISLIANDSGVDNTLRGGIYYMRLTLMYASGAPVVVIYDENSGSLIIE